MAIMKDEEMHLFKKRKRKTTSYTKYIIAF